MRKISRFYKTAIMQNLGLFIAMGLLNALFSEYGWFPNESIQEAITVLYAVVIPVFVAYACGKLSGEELGAAVSIIAMLGAVVEKNAYSIFIAMLVCPVIGFITNRLYRLIKEKIPSGFEMLVKNLLIGIVGVFFLLVVRMLAVAGISRVYDAIYGMANYFASHDMMGALSVIVEPLKVLFLNNSINYGILTPIGLEQMREFGKSLFFLVEANPGPGLGILLAFMCHYQEKRKKFATYALIESIGGIHEIYFPYVLTRPELILAAIAGGASGMAVFELAGAGMVGNVSPGSLIMFGILSAKGDMIWIFLGIIVSAVVSFGVASVILRWGKEKR